MAPNSNDRGLYMEFGCRITSSHYHEVTKGVGGKGKKKGKQEFHTRERKSIKYRAKFGRFDGAVKISWVLPSIKTE